MLATALPLSMPHEQSVRSLRSLKTKSPLLNWPPWYEPSVADSSLDDFSELADDATVVEDPSFGHILDRIIAFADWGTLARLRRVSQAFRRHVDAFQLRHIVLRSARRNCSSLEPEHFDVCVRGLNGRVIPALARQVRLTTSTGSVAMHQAEQRLFAMMDRHTRVLDLVGGFDEYSLGHLVFNHLDYLRILPDDGRYVSSFPFPARNLVLFTAGLPPHPGVRSGHMLARQRLHHTAKIVIVADDEYPFEPNRYWPALLRAPGTGAASSTVSHLVVIFQPQVKSTVRGRFGFGAHFWANAFHLETFDEEWLSVVKPPMAHAVQQVTSMAALQPRWPITLVGLKQMGHDKHVGAAGYLHGGRHRKDRHLLDSMRVMTMPQYAALLHLHAGPLAIALETLTAFCESR